MMQASTVILQKRKELELLLDNLLDESPFSLEHVKSIVYEEDDNDDFMKIVALFDEGQGPGELEDILDIVTDVWNYFPHKALGGKCPAELVSDESGGMDSEANIRK
jgi:hypothetical protein